MRHEPGTVGDGAFETVDLAKLVAWAEESGCECDVCEALRATELGFSISYRWRWTLVLVTLGLLLVCSLILILGPGGLPGIFDTVLAPSACP